MLRNRIIVCLLGLMVIVAHAQENPNGNKLIQERQTAHSVFQGALYRVWLKLRSLNPKPQAERVGRGRIVVTAGIRGAESTETALKPYWKDDRTEDSAFLEQIQSLNAAQQLLDEGKIQEAGTALQAFIKRYPEGELLPNALFAQGLAQNAAGNTSMGIKTLQRFVSDYPRHPLREDAEGLIAELGK